MTVVYTQKASGINTTVYDTSPYIAPSAGEGAPGYVKTQEDQVAVAQTGFGTAGNFYRFLRFPSTAKIKKLEIFSDLNAIDGGTSSSALTIAVGVIFSDSTTDGTPIPYQNMHPTTVGIAGGAITAGTVVAIGGASANYLFGTITANTSTGLIATANVNFMTSIASVLFGGEVTYGGAIATYGEPLAWTQGPLTTLFNFRDGQNNLIDSLGYMDIIMVCTHAYNTQPAAAYNLYGRLTFVA